MRGPRQAASGAWAGCRRVPGGCRGKGERRGPKQLCVPCSRETSVFRDRSDRRGCAQVYREGLLVSPLPRIGPVPSAAYEKVLWG